MRVGQFKRLRFKSGLNLLLSELALVLALALALALAHRIATRRESERERSYRERRICKSIQEIHLTFPHLSLSLPRTHPVPQARA